jgi:hypothetical protein
MSIILYWVATDRHSISVLSVHSFTVLSVHSFIVWSVIEPALISYSHATASCATDI